MTTLYICSISTTGKDEPDTVYTYIPVAAGTEGNTLYSITISHLQKDGSWHHSGAPSQAIMDSLMQRQPEAKPIEFIALPATIRKKPLGLKPGNKKHWYKMEVDLTARPPQPRAPGPRRIPLNWRRILFIAVLTVILLAPLNHYFPRQ